MAVRQGFVKVPDSAKADGGNDTDFCYIPCLSSMVGWFASDSKMLMTTNAVQMFGGYGYPREYPVERMMRGVNIT